MNIDDSHFEGKDWLAAELEDAFDEDYELEISEPALSMEIRKIYKRERPPVLDRPTYFKALLTLQAELIKLGKICLDSRQCAFECGLRMIYKNNIKSRLRKTLRNAGAHRARADNSNEFCLGVAHPAVNPPSTYMTCPVVNDDAGDNTGRDFGTADAITVQDSLGAEVAYTVSGASNQFTYDYDGNTQRGGASAGQDAPVTIVAIGLDTAQYVITTGTITRAKGLTFSLVSPLERNYSNP